MLILIVFYGIGRGGNVSINSYNDYLYAPLLDQGFTVRSIHVTKRVTTLSNQRTSEFGELVPTTISRCKDDLVAVLEAEHLDDHGVYEYSLGFRDPHNDGYASNRNLAHQLCKLEHSTTLASYLDFDRVIMLRDDLVFHGSPIDWRRMFNLAKHGPVVTKWFWNAGVSERFIAAMPETALKISERIVFAKDSIRHFGFFNGEYLMAYTLQRLGLNPIAIDLRFSRVRLNQRIHAEQFSPALWRPQEVFRVFLAQSRAAYYGIISRPQP